ncbi:unnamed protein product [Chondrus crispus]|uniref:Glutathione peroxidase n=1 Tax=Chondrus crispus TaxID=2769 RepID=R7QGH4_CHOCR|nr:unnamed protein product [Chondrus crispus]CDF37194.1 unnamed protein product [Chondrus crispus]|eukprot:XP_005717013.1 unnamed protein product [Chondrus crispus]
MFDFSKLKGDVVFVSNVASSDDYTEPMYKMMAGLLDKYGESGFHVLAFPSNWFGQKEWGKAEEIKNYVHTTYSDKIKLFALTDVEWNQVFALGCKHYPGEIIWNFHGQFLFNRDGIPVARFDLLSTEEYVTSRVGQEVLFGGGTDPLLEFPEPGQEAETEVGAA